MRASAVLIIALGATAGAWAEPLDLRGALEPLQTGEGQPEPNHNFFDYDWSLGLRGSYIEDNDGGRFETLAVPSVSLTHEGRRLDFSLDGDAELVLPVDEDEARIRALRLGGGAVYRLDSLTDLTVGTNFSITQDSAGTPGLPTDIDTAPRTITGGADVGIRREFGKFNVTATGDVERRSFGTTVFNDGTEADNSDQDYTAFGSTLRLGFQATPVFEVFGEAGISRNVFDRASDGTGLLPDATNQSVRAGVAGQWNSVLEAQASVGLNLRKFDADDFGEVQSTLYDASLVYNPNRTTRLTAGFTTTVAPPGPNSAGTTRVQYDARAELAYRANSWLGYRLSANWRTAEFEGSDRTEKFYKFGVGADYLVNVHTRVSADYSFGHEETSFQEPEDSQRVTLGVTLTR